MKYEDILRLIQEIASIGRDKQILHLTTEDETYNGRTIKQQGQHLINFGSYSYLGFNLDERVKNGAIEAIKKYGIQLSASRAYISNTLYVEFERLFGEIFNAPLVAFNSTALAHQANLPNLMGKKDVVILDHQVHASVQYASSNLTTTGAKVTMVRHNNLKDLEAKIIQFSNQYEKIWYLADSVYSMFGDFAPIKELEALLNKYPKFHLYMDDAHGVSWIGTKGSGYVLNEMNFHERLVLVVSLNKGFGSGGALTIYPNDKMRQTVRDAGGNLIFSGQMYSAVLGAGIECAKIHLSDELPLLQKELKRKSFLLHDLFIEKGLPIVSERLSPIKFVALGKPNVGYNLIGKLIQEGYYVNLAIFPAVPGKRTGLRITVSSHLTDEDIIGLANVIERHYEKALEEEGSSLEEVIKAFNPVSTFSLPHKKILRGRKQAKLYSIEKYDSIQKVNKEVWNSVLGDEGMFDWNGLLFLETVFKGNDDKRNNWVFNYLIIRGINNEILLATFYTIALSKDDMLATVDQSKKIEEQRKINPDHLISKSLILGSLMTDGEHIYINRDYKDWRKVFISFLDIIYEVQEEQKIEAIYLRDFKTEDQDIKKLLLDHGFVPLRTPNSAELILNGWMTPEEYLKNMKHKNRYYLKKEVLEYSDFFEVSIVQSPTFTELNEMYQLYLNVKQTSFELNGFDLPISFFNEMAQYKSCDIMQLHIKPEFSISGKKELASTTFNYLSESYNYCGLILGLDYRYIQTHNLYKQTIYQSILRAKKLNSKKMYLGLTASMIKSKFGASKKNFCAYVQVNDTFKSSFINFIN